MYVTKRGETSKNQPYKSLKDDNKLKRVKKNPIQNILSTLPQLAISFAILCFASTSFQSITVKLSSLFYIALTTGLIVCIVFLILQLQGAEYKNWQQNPKTKQYIQLASLCTLISFFGFNISLWSIYGILTPIIIIAGFVFILSLLIIITTVFIS
ncbi:uncharacterized protein BX663DRAFT_502827 [Cokeromyces recurvatus]|uniref:uncharacterized protein n=1 Tax=Cokeromyces recurvatus TaxID=90255 RepID=UPI00221F27E5|nr:uncharacterized protein BX663DRAFT_502827 [Cokeromyces recurvatus]KAI7904566.1 hypothetical protein BX663DRAFT_502827 [Cokeromyces recurvatus]